MMPDNTAARCQCGDPIAPGIHRRIGECSPPFETAANEAAIITGHPGRSVYPCSECDGTGTVTAMFVFGPQEQDCTSCNGKGWR